MQRWWRSFGYDHWISELIFGFINIELLVGFFSGFLIAIAQLIYIRNIYSFKVKPSVLSWIGWSILMGVGVFSQIINDGFDWSQAGLLLSTFGCLFIALFSIFINNFSLIKSDWWFLFLGFLSIGVILSQKILLSRLCLLLLQTFY